MNKPVKLDFWDITNIHYKGVSVIAAHIFINANISTILGDPHRAGSILEKAIVAHLVTLDDKEVILVEFDQCIPEEIFEGVTVSLSDILKHTVADDHYSVPRNAVSGFINENARLELKREEGSREIIVTLTIDYPDSRAKFITQGKFELREDLEHLLAIELYEDGA